eukprot:CAMPEP_0168782494 /NCGR_PEP_ID=MMETSP0725-20121227/9193_1 /TAXON_ID=265536 /ORGANISM="Amphiprora sp., Strain CCMP467" /LENGTH=362 /DNA_ID=CAMNT_0008832429 /DNA_START=25 /DNA_END=1113 /DNA_ORIENTATION=+
MVFNKVTVAALLLSAGSAAAFAPKPATAFVAKSVATSAPVSNSAATHSTGCACGSCQRNSPFAVLFSAVEETAEAAADVPAEVEALDGIESSDEAHNAERPARKSLKKKGPRGKPLSEYSTGDTVSAKVKTITSYGAFLDIGASTDGLLHISQLCADFVSDVNEVLKVGQEVDVRIINIDENKGQVALTLLSEDEEEAAKEAQNSSRKQRDRPGRGGNRRDDGAVLASLVEKGWNSEQFVEGQVVSTVEFGAFVRVDAGQLAEGVEGQFDGLVHISALTAGRADAVTNFVNVDDKVQVRVKAINDRKVSLTMVSPEDEAARKEAMGGSVEVQGAKDWKESLQKMKADMPEFKNRPVVVDLRK